jgi:hypothetical protein
MNLRIPRSHRRARIVSGLMLASALTLGPALPLPVFAQETAPMKPIGIGNRAPTPIGTVEP